MIEKRENDIEILDTYFIFINKIFINKIFINLAMIWSVFRVIYFKKNRST